MKKYLKDGREVVVEHETTDGYLVVRPTLCCDVDECYGEANVVVVAISEVSENPPVESYHSSIAVLKEEIFNQKARREKLRIEINASEKELRKIKGELNNEDMVIAYAIKKARTFIENPSLLVDYFSNQITHIVTYNQYCAGIHSLGDIYKTNLDLRFESNGNRRAVLSVKINDSYWYGKAFRSKESAFQFLKEQLECLFVNDREEYSIKAAKEHGISLDNKYINQYNKRKEQEKERKKKSLEKQIAELGK